MIKQLKTISVPTILAPCSFSEVNEYDVERKDDEAELRESLQEGFTLFATHIMVVDKVGYIVYILIKEE